MSSLAAVGRIAFDSVPEYAAYAAKVVDCEMRPRRSTVRPVVFSGEDQSRAIAIAKASLVSPWLDRIRALTGDSRWRIDATTVASNGTAGLIEAARDADVLFTVTHGVGSNMSYSERRTLQGALLTRPGDLLRGEDVSTSRFVPGGVWFMHACYGAGTPSTSIYAQWIQDLYSSERLKARQLKSITEASLGPTERPFVAQLPKCALANPEGPVAIIAHLDLAWTYGFLHDGDRLFSSIRIALRGSRVGRAIEQIANKHLSVSDQLAELYAARRGQKSSNPREVAQLWMLRQDLRSYVLLGDPAARVNLTERRTTT